MFTRSAFLLPLLFLCQTGSPFVSAGELVMFRGNAAHTGVSASPAPRQLRLKWVFDPGPTPGSAEAIFSSPAVANGLVYIGSSDNRLYALDAATGEKKWQFNTSGGPNKSGGNVSSSPAVSDRSVYFMCADGNFYAVDAKTGALQWTFATEGEHRFTAAGVNYTQPMTETMPDIWDFFLSSPTVARGAVYFGCGDGYIYSLNASTGALLWKYKTGNVVHASPAVADGVVYIGSFDTFFYALDAENGKLLWKYKTGDDDYSHNQTGLPGSAAVADGTVYFGCRDANLYALDARDGRLRWKFSNNQSWVIASPAVLDHVVYFTTSDARKFEALDAETGKELYSLQYGTYAFSSPTLAGGMAYFGTFDGQLQVVDLAKHAFAGSFGVPGYHENKNRYLTAKGELKNDVWFGETLEDAIVALRTRVFALGSILSTPCVDHSVVYFGSVDGRVYALGD